MRKESRLSGHLLRASAALSVGFLSSCAVMESTRIGSVLEYNAKPVVACESQLGSYALPKNFVRAVVHRVTKNSVAENVLSAVEVTSRGDSRRSFCLDYLASALARDQVIVKRSGGTDLSSPSQLLQVVASNSVDQSAIIIRRFIQAAFVAIGNVGFRKLSPADEKIAELVADLEFDPFDQVQSAYANETLRKFGFCLVLEHYTFGRDPTRPDRRGVSASAAYCSDPLAIAARPTEFATVYADLDKGDVPPISTGIVYRPRTSFQLSIYGKDDPGGVERWKLRSSQPLFMVNVSPILNIRVDRNIFATKRIVLKLEDGVLTSVCLYKTSELVEAIEIPLEVVKAVVRLPTQLIQIQYDQIKSENNLLSAESSLIAEQKKYLALLQGAEEAASANNAPTPLGAPPKDRNVVTPISSRTEGTLTELNNHVTGCVKSNNTGATSAPTNG